MKNIRKNEDLIHNNFNVDDSLKRNENHPIKVYFATSNGENSG